MPKVNGPRVEGSIKVSNQTEQDFDFTFIALAVDPTGRATAVGYQHFTLKKETDEFEIPFGENLPTGTYDLHADGIAEVAETNTIYRAHLATAEKVQSRKVRKQAIWCALMSEWRKNEIQPCGTGRSRS